MALDWTQTQLAAIRRAGYSADAFDRLFLTPLGGGDTAGGGAGIPLSTFAGGGALTQDNFQIAIDAAIQAAYFGTEYPNGLTVSIPQGEWLTTGIYIAGQGEGRPFTMVGAGRGITIIKPFPGYTGNVVHFDGMPFYDDAGVLGCRWGGIQHMSIRGNSSPSATGLRMTGCIFLSTIGVEVSGFPTGTGFSTLIVPSRPAGAYMQNCSFFDLYLAQCAVGMEAWDQAVSNYYNLICNQNLEQDIKLLGNNGINIFGGMFQSVLPYSIEQISGIDDYPGDRIAVYNTYHEGATTAMVRLIDFGETGSASDFRLQDYYWEGDLCVESTAGHFIRLENPIYQLTAPQKYVSSTNASQIELSTRFGPLENPELFQLDDTSRQNTLVRSAGQLFAGQRPNGYTVTGVLRDLAKDIFDFSIASSLSIVSGDVQSVTGLIEGTVLTAPSGARRPTYTQYNTAYNNNATILVDTTDNQVLFGTLATPFQVGDNIGCFVVFRNPTGGASANLNAVGASTGASGAPQYYFGTGSDAVAGVDPNIYFRGVKVPGSSQPSTSIPGTGIHAVLGITYRGITSGPVAAGQTQVWVDGVLSANEFPSGTINPQTAAAVDTLSLPAGSTLASGNLEIAYVAFLKRSPSLGEIQALFELASQRWGTPFA